MDASEEPHPHGVATIMDTILASTGPLPILGFVGRRSSGAGYAIATDGHALEVAERDGTWHAVRRVAASTIPASARAKLPPLAVAAADDHEAVELRGEVYVIRSYGPTSELWDSGVPVKAHYTDRAAVIRRAQSLDGSTVRVLRVPLARVDDVSIASEWAHVVWG